MNKNLIIQILFAYQVFNDGCLTIITNYKTFEDCRIINFNLDFVYVRYKDNKLVLIDFNNIISIQFTDKAALVGMK